MKITILTSRYPSDSNPYNHMFVHTRCVEMVKNGIDVEVFVCAPKSLKYTYENIEVRELPASDIIQKISNKNLVYLHLLNLYPFQENDGWIIYKHILSNKIPFVFYVHGNETQKYSSRKYEFNYRISDVLKWIKKDLWVIPKMRQFVKSAKNGLYILPSKWMKNEMERNLNLKIEHSRILPNGIDTDLFRFSDKSENRFKIITIRSLSQKVYDIEKTIEVMDFLPEQYTLTIYGRGIYEEKYRNLINKKNLSNRIEIISSFFSKQQMSELFKKYGVFISTTRMDSQGITMMEAMASGLLVVSTDNSSKREFITDGESGVLGISARGIAEKIIPIVNDLGKFKQTVSNGRKQIEKIDLKRITQEEIAILKEHKNSVNQ